MIITHGYHYSRKARFWVEHSVFTVPIIDVAAQLVIHALIKSSWHYHEIREPRIIWGSPEQPSDSALARFARSNVARALLPTVHGPSKQESVTWKFSGTADVIDAEMHFYLRNRHWTRSANSDRMSQVVNDHLQKIIARAEEVSVCFSLL